MSFNTSIKPHSTHREILWHLCQRTLWNQFSVSNVTKRNKWQNLNELLAQKSFQQNVHNIAIGQRSPTWHHTTSEDQLRSPQAGSTNSTKR